jgi:hypothetical protein
MDSRTMHFGMGEVASVDSLVILWPGAVRYSISNFKTDKWFYTIYESGAMDSVSGINGRSQLPENLTLTVYPNPFNSACRIATKNPIEIFDVTGKTVFTDESGFEKKWNGRSDENSELPSGLYLIKDKTTGAVAKVVLVR